MSYGAALIICASYYPIRGGHCNDGFRCGLLFVSANGSISLAYWTDGAALSFKLIASYYPIHGGYSSDGIICGIFSVLARYTAPSTGWYGAALDIASYYSMRGGRSNSGIYCGKFNFYIGILNSVSNWSYGAALL